MRRHAALTRDEIIGADAVRGLLGQGAPAPAAQPADDGIERTIRARIDFLARTEPASLDDGSLYDRIISEVERPLIMVMLARHGGNQLRAARAMGINRNTLRKRLDVLGIDPEER
jgi:two-component system nitrogen regulation response regulator GlnG